MSDYSGATVELEVARYGLRTFKPILLSSFIIFGGTPPEPDAIDRDTVLGPVYISGSQHWLDGTCKAECLGDYGAFPGVIRAMNLLAGVEGSEHIAPQEDCGCGSYATHTLEHLVDQYPSQAGRVVAVIAAEGQTIMGDKGFRTQFARVVAYWCADTLQDPCQRQFKDAQRYGDLNDMLKAYDFPYVEKPVWVLQKIEHAMVNMFGPGSLAVGGSSA